MKITDNHFDIKAGKEDLRKIGVNFVTTGIISGLINHFEGDYSLSLWGSLFMTLLGICALICGLKRRKETWT